MTLPGKHIVLCGILLITGTVRPQSGFVTPGDNLVIDGIPPVPQSIAERVARYTEFRSARLFSWHPAGTEMLIGTRFGETIQIHSKPLFVIQGKNDPRVPAFESDQIVEAMKQRNTPVWYLVATDEGHGFSKRRNQDYQFYATVMFVQRFLLHE